MSGETVVVKELSEKRKKELTEICNEVIDLLRETHHLEPLECYFVLEHLLGSLKELLLEEISKNLTEMKKK